MRTSSPLPPGFGVDPGELGTSKPTSSQPNSLGSIRPTLWIGDEGNEEDDAFGSFHSAHAPGSIVVATVCIGIVVAALAYVLDFPLS